MATEDAANAAAEEAQRLSDVRHELSTQRPPERQCATCLERFRVGNTALLPCGHTVCGGCVRAPSSDGVCPVCGTRTGAGPWPASPFIETQLVEPAACAMCGADGDYVVATHTCKECGPICHGDYARHGTRPSLKTHTVTPLKAPVELTCIKHRRVLEAFCLKCEVAICLECPLDGHRLPEHEAVTIAAHQDTLRQKLESARTPAQSRAGELETLLAQARQTHTGWDESHANVKLRIDTAFEALAQLVAQRHETTLQDAASLFAAEQEALAHDAAAAKLRWLALQGGVILAERLEASETTGVVLSALAPATAAHLVSTTTSPCALAPSVGVIEFELDADVETTLRRAGRLKHRSAFGPNCVAIGDGLTNAFVSAASAFTVTTYSRTGEALKSGGDRIAVALLPAVPAVGVEASGPPTSCAVDVAITDRGDGSYPVAYKGAREGDHCLHVSVNGHAIQKSPFAVKVLQSVLLTFGGGSFYDNRGVLYYLATSGGTQPWRDPHTSGVVAVTYSGLDGGSVDRFVGNRFLADRYNYTSSTPSSWMAVDLKGKRVRPTGYVLSGDKFTSSGSYHLRHWRIEGSVDGATWTTLRVHSNDRSITQASPSAYWPIDNATSAFTHFRILQTGMNSSGS